MPLQGPRLLHGVDTPTQGQAKWDRGGEADTGEGHVDDECVGEDNTGCVVVAKVVRRVHMKGS
jgi:hypothetical protein